MRPAIATPKVATDPVVDATVPARYGAMRWELIFSPKRSCREVVALAAILLASAWCGQFRQ